MMSDTTILSPSQIRTTRTAWSQALQRRVMRLLSHLDPELFQGQFRTFYAQSAHPQLPLLQFYDRYLRLQLLSEELLDDIMPRIRRQMNLQTNHISLQEDAPTRGEIDWPRTLQRNLDEAPDAAPLRFDTTRRETSMVTSENQFVGGVLNTYYQALQDVLMEDLTSSLLTAQECQQLSSITERLERELAVPDVRQLLLNMQYLDMEHLSQQVMERLRPGVSPYRDLLAWWTQFSTLHIGTAVGQRQLTFTTKRQDAESVQWLYQLWTTLELITYLHEKKLLQQETLRIETDRISFHFDWQQRRFVFQYSRQFPHEQMQASGWTHLTADIPTYTIAREKPLTITANETLIWQEPPLPLYASYIDAEIAEHRQHSRHLAIQQLLGTMQLLGAPQGIFLVANLSNVLELTAVVQTIAVDMQTYVAHSEATGTIFEYQLTPDLSLEQLQQRWQALLQQATDALPVRDEPACHGILLDVDSINASRDRLISGNVLCPKPHIGKGVVDLVHREQHCLKDPRFCHIFGQEMRRPFALRADTLQEIGEQTQDARAQGSHLLQQAEQAGDEARVENLTSTIFLSVGRSIERYVKMRSNLSNIEDHYEEWVFGVYWKKHPRCFSADTRNILLSAAYVWDEYKQNAALIDWAAPAIQYCRALETELKRRLLDHYPDKRNGGFDVPRGDMTLGAVATIINNQDRDIQSANDSKDRGKINVSKRNWALCLNLVASSHSDPKAFAAELKRFTTERVVANRNALAHGGAISRTVAQELRDSIIGQKGKPGILYWLAENLAPK